MGDRNNCSLSPNEFNENKKDCHRKKCYPNEISDHSENMLQLKQEQKNPKQTLKKEIQNIQRYKGSHIPAKDGDEAEIERTKLKEIKFTSPSTLSNMENRRLERSKKR